METKVFKKLSLIFGIAWVVLFQISGASYVPGEIVVKLKEGEEQAVRQVYTYFGIETVSNLNVSFGHFQLIRFNSLRKSMESLIKVLNRDPRIEYAEPNYIYSVSNIPTQKVSRVKEQWGLVNIDVARAWTLTKGSRDIKIAMINTGVDYTHPNLRRNIWVNEAEANGVKGVDDDKNGFVDDIHGYDFINNDGNPMDGHGHGTHTAGIVGATHNNGIGVQGVMANVSLVAIKFLSDDNGSGTLSDAIQAIDYAIQLDVDILSCPWGGSHFSLALENAIENARKEGLILVAAAGNGGKNNDLKPHYPAAYRVGNVISVAAHTKDNQLARYSSYGKETVHISAPGHKILSTMTGGTYKVFSGTSMSVPFVTGALGLLLSREGRMGHWELRERLLRTAIRVPAYAGKVMSGGRLSVYNLLTDTSPLMSPHF